MHDIPYDKERKKHTQTHKDMGKETSTFAPKRQISSLTIPSCWLALFFPGILLPCIHSF